MPDPSPEFGVRLSLAMKLLNISRGALASEARADKSLVSRWIRGITAPRGHNVATLTAIVRARAPGFTQLSWDLPLDAFAAALGGDGRVAVAKPDAPALPLRAPTIVAEGPSPHPPTGLQRSRVQSEIEVGREGQAYPGVYAGFRVAFRNSGELVPDLIIVWRLGERLFFRVFDPSFSHTGEVFILRHQLFVVGEDDQRIDGLISYILNGVTGRRAYRLDGVAMTVANDRHRTPAAGPVVWQRIADLVDASTPPATADLAAISALMKAAHLADRIADIAGPRIAAAVRPRIGVTLADGSIEHLVRRPLDQSLAASEMEYTPGLAAELARVQAAFVPESLAASLRLELKPHDD